MYVEGLAVDAPAPKQSKACVSHYQPSENPASEGWEGTKHCQHSRLFSLLVGSNRTMEKSPLLICPETTPPKYVLPVWRQHFIRFITVACCPALPPWCGLLEHGEAHWLQVQFYAVPWWQVLQCVPA